MKVAVITGAASGIGRALSQICLQKGTTVFMVDKDEPKLKDEAKKLLTEYPDQVLFMPCDVTKKEEVSRLVKKIDEESGRVDWIYNNAGVIGNLGAIWDLNTEHIRQVMDVNLFGMVNIIQGFMPLLFKQKFHSHIVNMASLYALCTGSQMAAYSMSKHAVLALSESLYFDLKRLEKPVEVSVVFPSFTDTSLFANTCAEINPVFHDSLNSLLAHSRPALDVAMHIVQEVEQKKFYILPDKEVKGYCEERTQSILLQEFPHRNNVEKLMGSILKRC